MQTVLNGDVGGNRSNYSLKYCFANKYSTIPNRPQHSYFISFSRFFPLQIIKGISDQIFQLLLFLQRSLRFPGLTGKSRKPQPLCICGLNHIFGIFSEFF